MANELQEEFSMSQNNANVPANAAANTNVSREMEEVKGQIFMAKQFPRNTYQAQKRIEDACKRKSLAESATYSYPRGGAKVTGPSIRLAEVLAQNWGNISFGFKELDQNKEESTAMAYAWDVETNTRQERIFTVPHKRVAYGKISVLTDPRDIYELIANQASRRVRACILSIIPGDVVEDAVNECEKTLQGDNKQPLKDRLTSALDLFKNDFDVNQSQVEDYFGYSISEFAEKDLMTLGGIYSSLKDHMTKVSDWFDAIAEKSPKKIESDVVKDFDKKKSDEDKEDSKSVRKSGDSSDTKPKPRKETNKEIIEQSKLL